MSPSPRWSSFGCILSAVMMLHCGSKSKGGGGDDDSSSYTPQQFCDDLCKCAGDGCNQDGVPACVEQLESAKTTAADAGCDAEAAAYMNCLQDLKCTNNALDVHQCDDKGTAVEQCEAKGGTATGGGGG